VVREALRIVRSPEGDDLRKSLNDNAVTLRRELEKHGIRCIGVPSAIVPAHVGEEAVGRIAWSKSAGRGVHANLVEFPAVAVGAARFRMQVMPGHTEAQLVKSADVVAEEISKAREEVAGMQIPKRVRPRVSSTSAEFSTGMKALPQFKKSDMEKLLSVARMEKHPAGTMFIHAGTSHGSLFIIQNGTAHVVLNHNGQEVVIAECGPGEIIGEISMLDGKGASASVIAETDTEVACIEQSAVARMTKADPDFGMRLYQSLAIVLARRLRKQDVHQLPGFTG